MCINHAKGQNLRCWFPLFSLDSQEISVAERDLAAGIVSQPEMVTVDQEFNVTLEIVDAVTGEKVEDIAWKVDIVQNFYFMVIICIKTKRIIDLK